jgi:CRP/FNR family transcriptional regulator, cyclic AMP receptor protein
VSREATVDESQILAALGSVPLFAGLGKRDLRRIAGASTIAHVPAGHHVVREGFSAEAFYIILDGQASVTGPAATTHLRPGDFCGELGLLDGSPRSASVLAQSDIVAVRLPRREFLEMVDRRPEIARALLADMAGRVRRLETTLRELEVRKPQDSGDILDDSGGIR